MPLQAEDGSEGGSHNAAHRAPAAAAKEGGATQARECGSAKEFNWVPKLGGGRSEGSLDLPGKRGCGLDYPHNVQFHISPLPNAQKIDEFPPWGDENVDLEDLRVQPTHDISNVRSAPPSRDAWL